MPRTKQNNPKNLKDKIEEAQKELKDPKSSQKGITESSQRNADIKGLKRKKVVAENQQKKIPKSPVKEPLQSSQPETALPEVSAKADTPSGFSYPSSPSHNPCRSAHGKGDTEYANTAAAFTDEEPSSTEHERLKQVEISKSQSLDANGNEDGIVTANEESQSEDSSSSDTAFDSDSYYTTAPLEVLLKAMEPDFSTLSDRKSSLPTTTKKPEPVLSVQYQNLQNQPSHMQTYYVDKRGSIIGIATPLQSNMHCSAQANPLQTLQPAAPHYMPVASSQEKPGSHIGFSTGPSTITHSLVPSGSTVLPQSQPPVVQTCQSLSASVPSTIQVSVTPECNQVQMARVMHFGTEQAAKDHKPKKQGKYVCEYCSRPCAKPSVLLKHIRSHTGERPYPCVTCGFSFKTKSNLYKHKKSHAHTIKLGLVARSESGGGSLFQESDKAFGTHSEADESGDSDEESSTADLDPDSSQSSVTAFSESSLLSACAVQASHEADPSADPEAVKPGFGPRCYEPKVTAALPKVVVYPVNVSPLRADSPRVIDSAPEQSAVQRPRDFNPRASITVLSSLKEVDCSNPSLDIVSEDEDQHCKSPLLAGHAQLQRQQATDFSQQHQAKCLLSPRSLGSTDSGYFSRSESADQAMSPPSPFVKITPPADMDISKNTSPNNPHMIAAVMHVTTEEKAPTTQGHMRPPLEAKALSLEERISKLISDNEAVVDNKQLDSVKPRRTSLSRRGSIDSPKSYIFKDSFQFDLKPMGRRSSSSSDIPKSPFTPSDKSKPVYFLSVPSTYPPMDCLPITRSNSMPTTPGHSVLPLNVAPQPHPLRICQSFDDKIGSLNDDVFSSAPSTPNPAIHSRMLVRQVAVEDVSTNEGHMLPTVRSMDESCHAPRDPTEIIQRSRSFEHSQDRHRKQQQSKGTMYECETCRNRYRKLENFENHKKFYCSELHGPKNKHVAVKEPEPDVFPVNIQHPTVSKSIAITGILDHQTSIRKRRKMKSVGDDEDQSPTDTIAPCSVSFDSCQLPAPRLIQTFSQYAVMVDMQPKGNQAHLPQIQLVPRGIDTAESRLSPIREAQNSTSTKERADLQRQGSGTSVIRHTNYLSRPSSFETSESFDRASPVDSMEKDNLCKTKPEAIAKHSPDSYHEKMSVPKCTDYGKQGTEHCVDSSPAVVDESATPVQQSRLVRQNNIQVPEILVTEEPDREHETQLSEPVDKPAESFSWPQRSESLSKLPAEKLPPKKKRIRLAQMEHSSGESSFESSLSRSLSKDSSLSRGSSVSASFDRDELSRSESPSRGDCVSKLTESQGLATAFSSLGVPGMMRRAASEQISCTQPSVEISCDYRSKSFDCGSVSHSRSLSACGPKPEHLQAFQVTQVPLIERRRGPLVRQMSLKIGPDSQQNVRKSIIPLEKLTITNVRSLHQHRSQQIHIANRPPIAQTFILHSTEPPLKIQQQMVQSINLGGPVQHPQIHGLPHPWHQASMVQICRKVQQPLSQIIVSHDNIHKSSDFEENKCFVPKYQLPCPALRPSQNLSFSSTPGTEIAMPILTIPIASQHLSVSKSTDVQHNIYLASHQPVENKRQPVILPGGPQMETVSQADAAPLPQILITHEQINSALSVSNKNIIQSVDNNIVSVPNMKDRPQTYTVSTQKHTGEMVPSLWSLQCAKKLASVTLCPQQEPTASSKRMLSPANSLDIYMEKHQKRAKDEHGVACLTDGRSVNYLNSKMAEMTRQRKLVRQVCTTEPVDSPIETEALPLPRNKLDGEDPETTDECKPMSPDDIVLNKNCTTIVSSEPGSSANITPANHSTSTPTNTTLKLQDKFDEQRKTPGKSPIRPSSFYGGQVKLASSVSVVNAKDSHRLSFPSLKTATTFTWCFLMKRKPLHIAQTDLKISAYAAWAVSSNNPNPLGLPTKVVMSLLDSKQNSKKIQYTSAIKTTGKSDMLAYSGKLKNVIPRVITQKSKMAENKNKSPPESQPSVESDKDLPTKTEPRRVKIFDGGYKSNEEYVYVRGRGRGKYICEECGIRCKKPSMLRKHIRTHSDVRPFHCVHCNFSFKTKGNLTKHMKSKAHSKKCMEMGVPEGLIEDQDAEDSAGDRSQVGSTDRPDSDGDDSDVPDDEDNEEEEEEEEDSQAESGLSTNPSVSASPQHAPSNPAEVPPSALLAQMSISSAPLPLYLRRRLPPVPTSDAGSVHMMSPVSPCRQMSIDYPEFDIPASPPVLGKGSKLGQDGSASLQTGEAVDRSTQTSSFTGLPHGPLHFHTQVPPPGTEGSGPRSGSQTHLFSHLPLHSQQPSRSPYSMVPVGGIQLVPAGLATYPAFVPIQAGPVQLTIPAVIHRNTSPLPAPTSSNHQPEASPTRPLVVQEPTLGSGRVLPCFPLGPVSGLEPFNYVGLPSSQLTLSATLGLQVLAASGPCQSTTGPQEQVPGLQILNIALPALIPSLSPFSALAPLPPEPPERRGSPEMLSLTAPQPEHGPGPARGSMSASPLSAVMSPSTTTGSPADRCACGRPGLGTGRRAESVQTVGDEGERGGRGERVRSKADDVEQLVAGGDGRALLPPPPLGASRQPVAKDYSDTSSDDEDRLVIAT